jgi:hypothetical protein
LSSFCRWLLGCQFMLGSGDGLFIINHNFLYVLTNAFLDM